VIPAAKDMVVVEYTEVGCEVKDNSIKFDGVE
jgi:hypothetical protein